LGSKTGMVKKSFLLVLLMLAVCGAEAQKIVLLQQGKPTSIRGLSVVNDNVAWVSGSNGYTARTTDGGKTWNWQQVKGFEKADFRAIAAFSDKVAVIMASGTPALILKTTDGGKNWQLKYRNTDTAYFLDAMAFAGKKHGFVLGDPVGNKFLLMETNDYGETWRPFATTPEAMPGEAAFAASGTCLRVAGGHIRIVSGGTVARLHDYSFGTRAWAVRKLPIIQGKVSQGAFSFAEGKNQSIFVGGDFAHDKVSDSVCVVEKRTAAGIMMLPAAGSPNGYQSCIEYLAGNTYLSTGTPGSNITTDGGTTWAKIDDGSFNVCRKARLGTLVLLAGDKGRIALFKP